MSTYAIGDIQGCYKEFKELLNIIKFNKKKDKLWLTGDLVNKGPKSFDVIKYLMDLEESAITVLGNHDFYLIASYFKAKPWPNKNNLFDEILNHKESDKIIKWLRNQKIIYFDEKLECILVHAGIHPSWKIQEILLISQKIENLLKSERCENFVKSLWSNEPNKWNSRLNIKDKLIFAVNVFTRIRYLNKDLSLDFNTKSNPIDANLDELIPWYECNHDLFNKYMFIIGHWSTLGYKKNKHLVSIDTGCAWGNKLTAIKILKDKNIKKYDIQC